MRSPKTASRRLDVGLVRPVVGTSPNPKRFFPFIGKEWRELLASRSFWLLLLMIGPLVGHGFITAVGLYAEASGIGGGPAALPQGLTPLDGMLVPAFGAYDLAATFLFPFVAIRAVDRVRSEPDPLRGGDLVAHQCEQRTDDERWPGTV